MAKKARIVDVGHWSRARSPCGSLSVEEKFFVAAIENSFLKFPEGLGVFKVTMRGLKVAERDKKLVGGRVSSRLTNVLSESRKVGESRFLRKEQVDLTSFCCGVTSRSNSES